MRPALRRALFSATLLGTAFLFAGCGALFGNRYNDFRAYYNAYYNASRVLEEGEQQLDRPDQVIDRTRLLSLYPSASGGRGSGFQEAIDKSSELLRARGDSKWADDALFLIGKAYYYQNNSVGAEQKFRETIELATVRGNERLADEARIWLGRTLGAAQRYEEGTTILQERLGAAEGNRGDLARIRLVLGELFAREGRYPEAIASLRDGLEDERDSDFAARGWMLLGQVLESDGKYAEATEAYGEVSRRQPPYELAYAAKLNQALVLGLDAGQTPEAIDLIRRMRRDDKNYVHRAEVELAYGRLLAASGETDDALEAMRSVLYDPLMAGGSLRGETHARLAEFYRDTRGDFVRASAHFDTASTALRTSLSPGEAPTRAALLNVRRTAGAFKAYSSVAVRLAEADSLYELGNLDDDAFAARIQAIEAQRLVEYREEQRRLAETRAAQDFGGGSGPVIRGDEGVPGGTTRQGIPGAGVSGVAAANAGGRDLGFLSFRELSSVQANLLNFQRVWGDRGLVPNWRRSAAIESGGVAALVGPGLDPSRSGANTPLGGPTPLDLSPIPRTPAALVTLRSERAALRYEAANSLFFSLARPDSAAALYTLALGDGPAPEVGQQIRFALAEVETARGDTETAEALYRELIEEAPESSLAGSARLRLGMEPTPEAVTIDSTSVAYEAVRSLWREKAYPEAVGGFLALAVDSSRVTVGPRALLAASATYIEWARADGFDVLRPLPDSLLPVGLFPERASAPGTALIPGPPEAPAATEASGAAPRVGAIPQPQTPAAAPESVVPESVVPGKPARTQQSTVPGKPAYTRPERTTPQPAPAPRQVEVPEAPPEPSAPAGRVVRTEGGDLELVPSVSAERREVPLRDRASDEPVRQIDEDEVRTSSQQRVGAPPPAPELGEPTPADSTLTPEALPDREESVLPDPEDAQPLATPDPLAGDPVVPDLETLGSEASGSEAAGSEAPGSVEFVPAADPVSAVPAGPTVADVLALVQTRAPGSAYARTAAALLGGLAPEASGAEVSTAVEQVEEPEIYVQYGFEGTEPLDSALGGFTWRAQRVPDAAAVQIILTDYLARDIRAAAVRDGDGYRIVVGQFETRPDAFGVREDLPAEVQGAGASIVPLVTLRLLSLEDLSSE